MDECEEQTKHPGGRPRLEFDLRQVEELGKIQSTQAELAAVLGCSVDTVKDRLKCDPEFSAAYIKGLESGKASLRRLQWKAALGGNITMQIWLGKQYLAQSDRQSTLLGQDPKGDPVAFVIDARPGQRGEEPTS
jgi:transcriptional regulator with XRE-family HTH domain